MSLRNLIENRLTPADMQTIDNALSTIQATIDGKVATLSPEEFQRYGSINEQHKLIVNKVYDIVTTQNNLADPEIDWTEFRSDYEARSFWSSRMAILEGIMEAMRATKTLHDKDNLDDALGEYKYLEYLSDRNKIGAKEAYQSIRQFFNTGSRTPKPDDSSTNTTNPPA